MQRARQDARVDEPIEIGNCEVWRCDGRAARLGRSEAGRANVAPIFERRDMGQKTRHAASVSQKGVCIVAPVGVGGESLRRIGVISGGLPVGRLDRWPGCSMVDLHARGLVAFMVVSGAPAVFGLFAARDIWKLRAKIAPENESAFECDAGVKMSKFEAPIDVIGRRGSLNKGES